MPSAQRPVDVAIGASVVVLETAAAVQRRARPVTGPAVRLLLRPPLLPPRLQPATLLASLGELGASRRAVLTRELSRLLDVLVPAVVGDLLRRAHLTETVIRYVDLDAVVGAVDLDAAARQLDLDAVLDRLDLTAVVLERVDVDAIARRLDLDAVLDRLDLTAVVLERVDVDAIARRLDLDAVLDRLDLTAVVLNRVDLQALVDAVLSRIDLPALAAEVVDDIDLPEIIRESSGSMASDTVRSARMQGIAADEAVGRAVDRLLLRRARRS